MKKTEIIDADDIEAAPAASDKDLKTIATLVQRMVKLQAEVDAAAAELDKKKKELAVVSEVSLPEAMSGAGFTAPTKMKLAGCEVEFDTAIHASINKANQDEAFAWLEKNGHGDLIKHEIKINFNKGDEKFFNKFVRDLAKRKKPVKADIKDSVHSGTLGAFVREQTASGGLSDKLNKLFGVFVRRFVSVKPLDA